MELNKTGNPWHGLQSYQEGDILYGRNSDIRELAQQVLSSECTLLFGKSGIGKSSILNAGVIPAARRNGYVPVLIRLSHNGSDNDYGKQIKNAVKRVLVSRGAGKFSESDCVKEIYPQINQNHETLYEYFHRHEFYAEEDGKLTRVKLLILFDQFEEIFTLQSNESFKQNFFAEFADVINNKTPKSLQVDASQDIDKGDKIDITSEKGFDQLFSSLKSDEPRAFDFVNDNDIHFVFTIREDFLSEFEYYTAFIPSLKRNRYGLRPINEQQAAEIILKPQPGLVDESVAVEIIERITKRSGIKLDGAPQIQVDVAILSLYLSRLYDAKNGDKITSTLIKEKGEHIIHDFYIEAIANLSESDVEYLEQNLLDANGHRDNIPVVTLKSKTSISDAELNSLCDEKKILRKFFYAGAMRVEFIHDILCDVVMHHKVEREQELQQQLQEQLAEEAQAKIKTRSRLVNCGIIVVSIIALVSLFKYMSNQQEIIETEAIKHKVIVSMLEDSTITATDYWKGNLEIIGEYPDGRNVTLLKKDIDKGDRDSLLVLDVDSINSIRLKLLFDDFREIGNYIDIDVSRTIRQLKENPSIKLSISRNLPKMAPYYGNVCLNVKGIKIPITDAAILVQDRFVRTDSLGNFNLSIEENLMANKELYLIVAKEGLACEQFKIHFDDEKLHKYVVQAADSTAFDDFLIEVDSINVHKNYSTCGYDIVPGKGVPVRFSDKTKSDRICLRAVKEQENGKDKIVNGRCRIRGYYYFQKEFDKKGVYAYHIFTGLIDKNYTTISASSCHKKYELVSYDVAMNKQTITGNFYKDTSRNISYWSGDIQTSWGIYAKFEN